MPDRYTCNARLYPSLLVIAPAVVAIVAIAKIEFSWLHSLWIGLGAAGGFYWLESAARDPRKALESGSGKHGEEHRRSRSCATVICGSTPLRRRVTIRAWSNLFPTQPRRRRTRKTDPKAADACYTAWSTYLRTGTRDQRFNLVFDELVGYGYRRNSGPAAIWFGVEHYRLLRVHTFIGAAIYQKHEVPDALWLALCADAFILLFWFFRVSPSWVRLTADHYGPG